jgi:hypothetical protein
VSSEAQSAEIVRLLLKAGSDPALNDLGGQSPVDWALKYSHPDVLQGLGVTASPPPAAAPIARLAEATVTPRVAVERSLRLLQTVSASFMKNGGCVACHAQNLTALAAKYAEQHSFPMDEPALKLQLADLVGSYSKNRDRLLQRYDGGGAIDTLSYAMLHFYAADYPADATTDAIVYNILSQQMANGSWIRGGAIQRAGPSPAARAPMQDSDVVRTAMSVLALKNYSWEGRRADLASHVDVARRWLLQGKPVYNEESVMQLLGLHWAGEDSGVTQRLARTLIAQQNTDGGWRQNPALPSDAYATGQTLFALREAGILTPADPVYQRGAQFLLRTQHPDGSWHVKSRAPKLQPYFQSGFPHDHDQWISMAATAWAAIALMSALT